MKNFSLKFIKFLDKHNLWSKWYILSMFLIPVLFAGLIISIFYFPRYTVIFPFTIIGYVMFVFNITKIHTDMLWEKMNDDLRRTRENFEAAFNRINIKSNISLYTKELKILGFNQEISNLKYTQVHSKYKELMKQNHPDLGGSLSKTQEINEAFLKIKKYYGRIS